MICFAISHSENSVSALELLRVAVELIEAAKGELEFVLVDGGIALKSAVDELNIGQNEKEKIYMTESRTVQYAQCVKWITWYKAKWLCTK